MSGGVGALRGEADSDEEDLKALAEMTEEEMDVVEAQFAKLYAADPELQAAVGSMNNLNLLQKYQILIQYQRESILGASQDMSMEIIEHEGKRFRRVQIEGQDGDHLMDESANIYTLDFQKIGKAGDSDEDD